MAHNHGGRSRSSSNNNGEMSSSPYSSPAAGGTSFTLFSPIPEVVALDKSRWLFLEEPVQFRH